MITFENGALTTDATLSVTDSQAIFQFADYCVQAEQDRIIKLLEDSRELRGHIYFWEEFGENDTEGRDRKERAIALIKGEK